MKLITLALIAAPLVASAQGFVCNSSQPTCPCLDMPGVWGDPRYSLGESGAGNICANPLYTAPGATVDVGGADPANAPEIDPAGALGALTLLAGLTAITRGRRAH